MQSNISHRRLRRFGWCFILLSIVLTAGCGGGGGSGGGGSGSSGGGNSAPAISFSASSSSVAVGETVTLTWSSSNTTSCSASASAGNTYSSGTENTSGTEDVPIVYGTNTFTLSCTGSGGTSSRIAIVEGTQILNESAFVPLGQTTTYEGFVFNKEVGSTGCLASIKMDLTNNNNFLSITNYHVNEWRTIGYGNEGQGLSLGDNQMTGESHEAGTFYSILIANSALNGIDVSEVNVDPYTFEASTIAELEQYSANISLDVEAGREDGSGFYCNPDMEMGLFAAPNSSSSATDSEFVGVSNNADGYTFLYMRSKDYVDSYSNNLPTEADIFSIDWDEIDLYTSYLSNPNIINNNVGFRVSSTSLIEADDINNASASTLQTMTGSRLATSMLSGSFELQGAAHFVKYLYPVDDSWSTQRIFLKADLPVSSQCFYPEGASYTCSFDDLEILFFTPDKEGLMGFKLGGFSGTAEISNVKIAFSRDD